MEREYGNASGAKWRGIPCTQIVPGLRENASPLELDHGAQGLAVVHGVESILRVPQADAPAHDLVELELAHQVPVGEQGKVARGEAVAVPADAQGPSTAKKVRQGKLELRVRPRHANNGTYAGQVTA